MAERVTVTRDDGELGTVEQGPDLDRLLESGFRVVDDREAIAIEKRREAQSGVGMAIGGVEAAARGATLGLSDVAARAIGVDMEAAQARRENLGTLGTGVELAGAVAPSLLTGGAGAAGTAARLTPAGAATRLGEVAAARVGGGRAARMATQGAVEGALGGTGAAASELALADKDLAVEQLLAGGGVGLGFGALTGAGLGGAGTALERGSIATGQGLAAVGGAAGRGFAAATGYAGRGLQYGATKAREIGGAALSSITGRAPSLADLTSRATLSKVGRAQGRLLGASDPDAFARSWGRLSSPADRARLLADPEALRETTAAAIKKTADDANAALDDAIRLTQGEAKLRRADQLMAGVDNATAQPRAVQYLRDQQARIQSTLDELGDSISPEMRRDLAKAKRLSDRALDDAIKGKTGSQAFRAVDDFKRELDTMASGRASQYSRQAAPEIQEVADTLRSFARETRAHLEDEATYGAAAVMQREMNAALSAEMRAMEKLGAKNSNLRKMFSKGEIADTDAALQLARAAGRYKGGAKLSAVDEVLDARMEMLKSARKHYDLSPEAVAKIDSAERAIQGMRSQLREQSATLGVLDDLDKLRKLEGGGSPSITTMSTIGPSVGGLVGLSVAGPIGAVVGSVAGTVTRPYTAVRFAAGAMQHFDTIKAMGAGLDAVKGMRDRVLSKMRSLADGVKSTAKKTGERVRDTARRAADATVRGVQATARATGTAVRVGGIQAQESARQREDRLLDVRAQVLEAAANPTLVAEAMEEAIAAIREVDPSLAMSIVERSSVAVQFLATKAPTVYRSEFGPGDPIVDTAEMDRFDRYVAAVSDPLGAVEKIADGILDVEASETLRVVYPKIFADLQSEVLAMIGKRKEEGIPTSHEALAQFSLLLDMPLDDTMRPGFFQPQQPAQEPAPQQRQPSSKPVEIKGYRTDLGRLEAGDLVG